MALRCFLFSSDEGTSDLIRQVITGLGVEAESCSQATSAVDKLARDLFQLVVIDWDQQPEAAMLLSAARERKASERPLTIAIVSDDAGVPKALQAGANSILRKPVLLNQATDILTTGRDLLRSREESTASAAAAAAGASTSSMPASMGTGAETSLRSGEFLQSTPMIPGRQFETDSEVTHFKEQSAAEETDPLKDLEPVAAAVPEAPPVLPSPPPDEPRGLESRLKARGVTRQPASVLATSPANSPDPPRNSKTELLGFDQTPSFTGRSASAEATQTASPEELAAHEKKQEARLFSYIAGEEKGEPEQRQSGFRIGKGPIIGALVLAACAIVAAPQAPWHGKLVGLTARGRRALHTWLNPQPVTAVTQAPASHEDFGRAGDEYKLPVVESIPDATTDPSQISVVPVVDPTVKKPPADTSTGQSAGTPEGSTAAPADMSQPNSTEPFTAQPPQTAPDPPQPAVPSGTAIPATTLADPPTHPDVAPANTTPVPSPKPAPAVPRPETATYTPAPTKVPSSLKSQIATMVPQASGNKPVEAALPAFEPVEVPELTERALLIDQPPLVYPANAAGKQGTVTLHVLIGRDGTVQDTKFLQGSLAFARPAIDGVKRWRFKPYTMNGRPVSVTTTVTLKFAPKQ
jgi:protein TonB